MSAKSLNQMGNVITKAVLTKSLIRIKPTMFKTVVKDKLQFSHLLSFPLYAAAKKNYVK